jgi:molecular chaperone GrpE
MNTEKSEESKAETGAEEAGIKDSTVSSESAHSPKEDYQTLYIRAMADLENFRKRVSKDKQEIIKMANASLFEALLPIIDNMKLGLEAAKNHPEAEEITKGFKMVLLQFKTVLEENGLKEIQPENSLFDPNLHESISYQPSETIAEDHVIETIRAGYVLNDRLIRAANVIVSSGKDNSKTE